jgi:hypothetical protein
MLSLAVYSCVHGAKLYFDNLTPDQGPYIQGWAKLVLIALERYSVELKRLTFNFR